MSDSFFLKNIQIAQALQEEPLRKSPVVFDAETHPNQQPFVEVWRMQNEKGEGPYNAKKTPSMWTDPYMGGEDRHPTPGGDSGFDQDDRLTIRGIKGPEGIKRLFGFESMDHLNNWFSPAEQARLAHHGFKPTKVKAKKVHSSGKQVFYEPYEEPKEEKLAASERPHNHHFAKIINSLHSGKTLSQIPHWSQSYLMHQASETPKESPVQDRVAHKAMGLFESHLPETQLRAKMLNDGDLYYHPKDGFKVNRKIKDVGDGGPLMKNDQKPLGLVHYSTTPSLKEINVDRMGTGAPSAEYKRGLPEVKRAYYYVKGTEPEDIVKQGAKAKYHATLQPHQKVYDLATDREGLVGKALEANNGAWNSDIVLKHIKDAGYHGYHNSQSSMPNVIALFHSMPIDKEEMV